MPERFDRRTFFWPVLPALFLAACESDAPIVFQREQGKRKEDNGPVKPGDMVLSGDRTYLIRSNISQRIADREKFLWLSKSKGRVIQSTGNAIVDIFDKYPRHDNIEVSNIIDPFSGELRIGMPLGGEGIVYFPGLLTERGFPLDKISFDNDGFVDVRRDLKEDKWELYNSNFFTYSALGLRTFRKADTLRDPTENIRNAIIYMSMLERDQPFVQFNVIAHSYGAVLALEAVRRHPDIVNNLILIDMPYVPDLHREEEYQDEIQEFGEEFTGSGKGLLTAKSKDDPHTKDAPDIESSELIVLEGGKHGDALKSKFVRGRIRAKIGLNRAA